MTDKNIGGTYRPLQRIYDAQPDQSGTMALKALNSGNLEAVAVAAKISGLSADIGAARDALAHKRGQLNAMRGQRAALEQRVAEADGKLSAAKGGAGEAKGGKKAAGSDAQDTAQKEANDLRAQLSMLDFRITDLGKDIKTSAKAIEGQEAELANLQGPQMAQARGRDQAKLDEANRQADQARARDEQLQQRSSQDDVQVAQGQQQQQQRAQQVEQSSTARPPRLGGDLDIPYAAESPGVPGAAEGALGSGPAQKRTRE